MRRRSELDDRGEVLLAEAFEEGLIPTDNAMGIMTVDRSPAADAFVALAATAGRPLLEVGAAYGNASAFRWLEPGGALYLLVITPSLSFYRVLRDEYERRARSGERWPGIFDPRPLEPPSWKRKLPPLVHLFEKDVLRRCADEAGFVTRDARVLLLRALPRRAPDGRSRLHHLHGTKAVLTPRPLVKDGCEVGLLRAQKVEVRACSSRCARTVGRRIRLARPLTSVRSR